MVSTELGCTILSSAAPDVAALHHFWAAWDPLSHAAPYTELRCTQLNSAAPYWATLHPTEQRGALLSYAAPYLVSPHHSWAGLHSLSYGVHYWTTLHSTQLAPTELGCTLRAVLQHSELRCTLPSYAAPYTELCCTLLSCLAPSEHLVKANSQHLLATLSLYYLIYKKMYNQLSTFICFYTREYFRKTFNVPFTAKNKLL